MLLIDGHGVGPQLAEGVCLGGGSHRSHPQCNFHSGRVRNPLPRCAGVGAAGRASPERTGSARGGGRYTPGDWEEVGRSCLFGWLDYHRSNP